MILICSGSFGVAGESSSEGSDQTKGNPSPIQTVGGASDGGGCATPGLEGYPVLKDLLNGAKSWGEVYRVDFLRQPDVIPYTPLISKMGIARLDGSYESINIKDLPSYKKALSQLVAWANRGSEKERAVAWSVLMLMERVEFYGIGLRFPTFVMGCQNQEDSPVAIYTFQLAAWVEYRPFLSTPAFNSLDFDSQVGFWIKEGFRALQYRDQVSFVNQGLTDLSESDLAKLVYAFAIFSPEDKSLPVDQIFRFPEKDRLKMRDMNGSELVTQRKLRESYLQSSLANDRRYRGLAASVSDFVESFNNFRAKFEKYVRDPYKHYPSMTLPEEAKVALAVIEADSHPQAKWEALFQALNVFYEANTSVFRGFVREERGEFFNSMKMTMGQRLEILALQRKAGDLREAQLVMGLESRNSLYSALAEKIPRLHRESTSQVTIKFGPNHTFDRISQAVLEGDENAASLLKDVVQ
ncbi:MAG: hypothetical protein AAF203_11355, partial [Pseudomonadota bacterium]